MAYIPLLLSLLAVDLLAAISPGPNFVVVTQAAIRRTRKYASTVVLGIVTANLIWCFAVVLGLSALFDIAPWLYVGIKLLGGVYLIYLGVSLWRSKSHVQTRSEPSFHSSLGTAYVRGLLTNLSNPKSVIYFASIFALFMSPGTPVWVQVIAICIVIADTVLWYGTVAILFSSVVVQRFYARIQRPVDRAAGAVMVGFGVRLMLVRE
jgi:threonine efflux protein